MEDTSTTGRVVRQCLLLWLAVTICFLAVNLLLLLFGGAGLLPRFIQNESLPEIPHRILAVPWLSVVLSHLTVGGALALLNVPSIRRGWGYEIAGIAAVTVMHLGFLHGRHFYGDVWDHLAAAARIEGKQSLPARYLYPPFWASLMGPLTIFGAQAFAATCWTLNILSFLLFQFLSIRTLRVYGLVRPVAAGVALFFAVLSVPVMRTLGYVQINLHVANLMLAMLNFYPAMRELSAMCLALAAHLKATPLLLGVLPLLRRDWRWLAWFVASVLVIGAATGLRSGFASYAEFFANARNIYVANGLWFSEHSIDSLVRSFIAFGWIPGKWLIPLVALLKLPVLVLMVWVCAVNIRRRTFVEDGPSSTVLNGAPAVLLGMVMLSPLVWEHHLVYAMLPFMLLVRKLDGPGEWAAYASAAFVAIAMPVFSFFPWSYARFVALVVIAVLLLRVSRRRGDGALYADLVARCRAAGLAGC